MSKLRWVQIGLFAVAAIAAVTVFVLTRPKAPPAEQSASASESEETAAVAPKGCILDAGDTVGGPIDLLDQNGAPVTQAHFSEAPTLIFFGFRFCPDVCPLALQKEKKILEALGQEGGVIQPVVITLDPERDGPKEMDAYVSSDAFAPGLLGLTGSPEQIAAAAKAFRVAWKKEASPDSAAEYTIVHSQMFYLMDESWRLKAMFPAGELSVEEAAQCVRAGLETTE
jgi:protein SCO1/2